MSGSISYSIKAEIHEFNANSRVDYALAAANGAVEASLKHAPLLYTSSDGVPEATLRALNNLGVKKITFIDFAGNDAVAEELAANFEVERLTSMKEVTQSIKALKSSQALALGDDDYLTVTSLATGDGYYAPASYLAAYHGSPVADIGAMGETYHWGTVTQLWLFYAGDWYHGSRSLGHLAMASQPIMDYIKNGELPPIGWDAELQWFSRIVEAVYAYADSIGIDRSGLEAYTFVAPKTDLCFTIHHALLGNESTAGQFIGKTPGESAAYVSRSVLYPAIIFGNPDRNITTSSLMNFRDGQGVRGNDGVQYYAYTSRNIERLFGAFGRDYRGHCAIDNLLVDQNRASLYYYSGHGTGGGGVSYHPDNWAGNTVGLGGYDAWRGYQYWQGKTPRSGGFVWYNVEGETYNLYHFKWCDRDWENLHSQFVGWMSCTTFAHFGPEVYLEHGAVFGFGNANTGLSPHWEVHDLYFLEKVLYEGKSVGEAYSETLWRFERDFTTMDPTSIYGSFSLVIHSDQVLYGDPTIYIYSPLHWTEPEPVDGF
ncbi:MAG: hypothetical protein DRN07_05495 [Thermoplasmata archaeon]|nr:MAG: hypothetical protein DRN07_05495 [Thermoplasmata archaeon]